MRSAHFLLVTVVIYFALRMAIIIEHEDSHSSAAWLLGYTTIPMTVVLGNPLTIRDWDGEVPCDQVIRYPGHPAEAIIGDVPLFMQGFFAALRMYMLQHSIPTQRKLVFYTLYLFVVINLIELIAYILMRPWAGSGDAGCFNEGFRLSPWPLFIVGTVFLALASNIHHVFFGEAGYASRRSIRIGSGKGVSSACRDFSTGSRQSFV